MYSAASKNVNRARYDAFNKTFKAKNVNEPFHKKLKNSDAPTLPSCKTELTQQQLRARYISSIWRNAHLKIPTDLRPENNGWTEIDGKLQFFWFDGEQLPKSVVDAIAGTPYCDSADVESKKGYSSTIILIVENCDSAFNFEII